MIKLYRILQSLFCVMLITAFIGCASTQKQENAGQYIDDSLITTKVKAGIIDDMSLRTFQISVNTLKGVVQLSGAVDSMQSVTKAGEIAGRVEGVKEVKNDLLVK